MAQTLNYTIGADRRAFVKDIQNFKIDFADDNNNWVQARQFERGMRQVFVNILNEDHTPFDMTGCNVWFEGLLPENSKGDFRVIDDTGFVPIDLQNGQFRFDLPGHAFAVAGSYRQAFFRIVKNGQSVTTLEFDLQVLADKVIGGLVPRTYISPLEQILEEVEADFAEHTKKFDDINADFKAKVTNLFDQLSKQGTETANMLTTVSARLGEIEEKIKSEGLFTQAEAETFEKTIQGQISKLGLIYEHVYPTLASLQADKNIVAGQTVKTGGYYALGDGGAAIYDVTDTKPDDYYEALANGLYAKLRYTPKVINVAQWGVNPSQADNHAKLQMIFDNYAQGANIYFPNGRYNVSKTLILSATNCRLVGDAKTEFQKTTTDLSGYTCIFNNRTIDLSKLDVALIIGPANNQNETVYHHQIKLESMSFSSPDITSPTRANYGIIAIGTAYLSLSHCFAYGFYLNIKQYESFGLNLSQTQSNGALTASLFLDHSIHASTVDCGFESIRPQASAIVATNKSIATITGSVITMNSVAADASSHLTMVGCSYETNYQTFRATVGATINVIGGDIERHQDPANSADTPLIYCTDSSKVYVNSASWRWSNYSGEPTWDHLRAYSTNQGCKIIITNCQFSNFPELTHYDGGADCVIWNTDLDLYKTYSAQISPADGVTIQGQTLKRDSNGQCFLNVGFTVTKDLGYMQSLISFPPTFKPWDGCYIQFLQQRTKQTYQAFTNDGQIKVYDTVPAGTEAILTFSYQAKD
ncbi:BppU family phage baseplate upper protein [Limosilactobacillus ingluviei]|uniref:BppU family phage baseplate upper protein n=1 Tax=Limosilactobacillus ingluviei TaxID=148604 RepID=UPI0003017DF7|nr:BppU family phage baseplate upper protein [Limosilactobacillus ingluviei]